jgi:hydroxymethylpyrimidine/phosphomethylpyrimidine kinase
MTVPEPLITGPQQRAPARVLSIAGSDSGGGAGIQADIKAITALGGYAMTAITALTAQNTLGVQGIYPVDPDFLRLQIRSVLNDLGTDAFKTGMVGGPAEIRVVAQEITAYRQQNVQTLFVLDPVMVAKGGAALLAKDAISTLKAYLFPLATVLTPNLPEAERLTGRSVETIQDMRVAARHLREETGAAVLLKGGHLSGDDLVDILLDDTGFTEFADKRIPTRHTHGTGCTLASALATLLAQNHAMADAISLSRQYVRNAILTAPGLGHGAGPLWHAHPFRK